MLSDMHPGRWLLLATACIVAAGQPPDGLVRRAGQTKVNPKDGLTYVWIPAGTFRMGCSFPDDRCPASEKPQHQVTITRGFWMGQTEVTQEAYTRVIGMNPSYSVGAQLPVEKVTWIDAQRYCQAVGMRLPTEAEWEYAARAGTTGSQYGDVEKIAWYADNSGKKRLDSAALAKKLNATNDPLEYVETLADNENRTHPVAQKDPNAWRLYDMLGNVSEWVADWFDPTYYSISPKVDPPGPSERHERTERGGSFYGGAPTLSDRDGLVPLNVTNLHGMRCVGN